MADGGPFCGADIDQLNRRAFVLLLFTTATGLAVLDRRTETLPWESVIRAGFPLDDTSIWDLGSTCAEILDNCSTLPEVVRHLRPCPAVRWVADGARSSIGHREVLARVGRLIADDYAAGDTVVAAGWVLSQTEVALCAAASIRARLGHA